VSRFIGCVHATSRALNPAHLLFACASDEFHYEDLIEERLLCSGAEPPNGRELFLDVLKRAEEKRPSAIFTTCSIYTKYLPQAREQLSVPVVGIDEEMIEQAALIGGPLALVGSLDASIAATEALILDRSGQLKNECRITAKKRVPVDACETDEGTKNLVKELRDLRESGNTVVVVQVSLSGVDRLLTEPERSRILTSSRSALHRLRTAVGEVL
jgi:hypothetical protein